MIRVGQGLDVHALGGEPPLKLLGVVVESSSGLAGHSDADVAAHAVIDALLGAAGMGDIGTRFPSSDERWAGYDSMEMLATVAEEVSAAGFRIGHLDVTILAQEVRIAPFREAMVARLTEVTGVASVSVKATTTDHLGMVGRGEGLAALAVATLSYDA